MINRVTVIGGSGFVGRATVERLARAGKQVIVLCRNSERAKFLKPMGNVGQITIMAGNVLDEAVLAKVIAPADAVVNLIGILAEVGGQRFDQLQGELPGRIGTVARRMMCNRLLIFRRSEPVILPQATTPKARRLGRWVC